MKKPKIYISGKITGDENDAPVNFKKAEIFLKEQGYEVVNPMTLPHKHGQTWCEYMREDLIAMLNGCTHIYMLKNYKESKGATIELGLASSLNFTLIFQ